VQVRSVDRTPAPGQKEIEMASASAAASQKQHPVEITIDDEPYTAPDHKMAARDIIALTGSGADDHYLVELIGKRQQKSYKGKPDEIVELHKGSTFTTVPTGGTEVS
jgi:Tfp pilus assembly major pilin PilA